MANRLNSEAKSIVKSVRTKFMISRGISLLLSILVTNNAQELCHMLIKVHSVVEEAKGRQIANDGTIRWLSDLIGVFLISSRVASGLQGFKGSPNDPGKGLCRTDTGEVSSHSMMERAIVVSSTSLRRLYGRHRHGQCGGLHACAGDESDQKVQPSSLRLHA
ncbi:hypothetical protein C2845_PM05G18910 [Panicum miliaceum]|uniref:Uncharacterized protein n=1 Tax=Panicum miliaceum TaxID=4540 RepID=A0A3L6T1J4_PANMI|nr:hypothetical protein C2845_PM05G18910 [Panicum miliaceum]